MTGPGDGRGELRHSCPSSRPPPATTHRTRPNRLPPPATNGDGWQRCDCRSGRARSGGRRLAGGNGRCGGREVRRDGGWRKGNGRGRRRASRAPRCGGCRGWRRGRWPWRGRGVVCGRGGGAIPSPWLARRPQDHPPYHRGHWAEARGDNTPVAAATPCGGGAVAAAEEVAVMHGQPAAQAGLAAVACYRGGKRGGGVALGGGLRSSSASPATTASAAGMASQAAGMASRGGPVAGVAMAAARGGAAAAADGNAPAAPVGSWAVVVGSVGGDGGNEGERPQGGGCTRALVFPPCRSFRHRPVRHLHPPPPARRRGARRRRARGGGDGRRHHGGGGSGRCASHGRPATYRQGVSVVAAVSRAAGEGASRREPFLTQRHPSHALRRRRRCPHPCRPGQTGRRRGGESIADARRAVVSGGGRRADRRP